MFTIALARSVPLQQQALRVPAGRTRMNVQLFAARISEIAGASQQVLGLFR